MPIDLSKVILATNVPAFRNYISGQTTINFSGTLTVPGGSVATSLGFSSTVIFPEDATLVNLFMSQDQVSSSGSKQNDYAANEIIKLPPYNEIIIPASSPGGLGGWEAVVNLDISGSQMTINVTAYNFGGIGSNVVFVPTAITFRYQAYLPTE